MKSARSYGTEEQSNEPRNTPHGEREDAKGPSGWTCPPPTTTAATFGWPLSFGAR